MPRPLSFGAFYQLILNRFGREATDGEYVAYVLRWLERDIAALQSHGAVEDFTVFLQIKT
jgi:hypothetical protein